MKKLFYLLFALPLLLLSCSDDNNLPELHVGRAVNSNAKDIAFGAVTYQLDYGLNYTTVLAPYAMTFDTSNLPVGRHLLRIFFPVYAVDYSPAQALIDYTLVITEPVENPDEGGDEGGETEGGETTFTVTPNIKAQ